MVNNKEAWHKISKIVRQIDTCVETSARTAHHRGERADLPVVVTAALGATRDVVLECASFMTEAAAKGAITRSIQKRSTADAAAGYLSIVEGLRELLKAKDNDCGLMTNPSADFGMIVNPVKVQMDKGGAANSATLPDIGTPWSKNDLEANITTIDTAYDGYKSTLNVMVNITDGLPWPLKAAPQTLLYILQLFENYQDARPKITRLIYSVQQIWDTLENITKRVTVEDDHLQRRLGAFLETLWRIVIRLRMVLHAGWAKRAMAIYSVNACLDVERQRIQQARDDITLTLQAETLARMSETHDRVDETGVLVKEIHVKMDRLQITDLPAPLVSTMSVTTALPPMPDIFHGRDELVAQAVSLLVKAGTVRLAVLGAGGMGKTSVALAIVHANPIMKHFENGRLFLSCEALSDADSLVIALAKLLGIEASKDLWATVVSCLETRSRTLLVLDNFETVWLVSDAVKASAVELLLSTLAKIHTLSFIITCRGNVLPPRVRWSNAATAALAPFSLEAAIQTFEDTADVELAGDDRVTAEKLLREVDMMPLAVILLGQLAQRGITVSELFNRWTRTRNALLGVRSAGREYNVDASIRLTIEMLTASTTSPEPLQLLAICCMLPDGLHPPIFEDLRKHFSDIDSARQVLRDYALVNVGVDSELRTLSPIRHFTLLHHPAEENYRDAIFAIYFDLAHRLGQSTDEGFKDRVAMGTPELGNLASLLLTLVHEPSYPIVKAVFDFTYFAYWLHPTVTVARALLPYLEQHPMWKAQCVEMIGLSQSMLCEDRSACNSFSAAMELYQEFGDHLAAAQCMRRAGDAHRLLGETEKAEALLNGALAVYIEHDDEYGAACCQFRLGALMHQISDYSAAIEHLTAARQTFDTLGRPISVAKCSESIGDVYLTLNDLESASAELEGARLVFISTGVQFHIAKSTRLLGTTHRRKGHLDLAEQLLGEVEVYYKEHPNRDNLAIYTTEVGYLRRDQGRREDAIRCFESALSDYEVLGWTADVEECREELKRLRTAVE